MGDIVDGKIGAEGLYDVEFKNGKLRAKVGYDSKMIDGHILVELEAAYILDKIKEAIPGTIDDAIIDAAKVMLSKV